MLKIVKRNENESSSIPYSVLGRETISRDFLRDPELNKDLLPQPYRRIDKILQELLDDTWNIIEKADTDKKLEAQKYRPDKIGRLSVMENLGNFNCLSISTEENSEFLFVGGPGSLACIDVDAMKIIEKIEVFDDFLLNQSSKAASKIELTQNIPSAQTPQTTLNTNIISVRSSFLKTMAYLVVSITDAGYVIMHLFVESKFFPIYFDVVEPDRKFIYKKCEISINCNFIAIYAESKTNSAESQIEVYKCTRDLWNQFVDSVLTANESARRQREDGTSLDAIENQITESQLSQLNLQQAQIPKPVLISRIRLPPNLLKLLPVNGQELSQLIKKTDSNLDCIGFGNNHCFSKFHLELKAQLCEKWFNNVELTDELMSSLSGNLEISNKIEIEFKFMSSNRFIYFQSNNETDIPNNLAVCWNNGSYLLFYPFSKINTNAKDLFCQIEYCMPFSSQITLIETSKCKNLIAFAFKNNNLVVFDLNAGIDRCCVNLENIDSIKRIAFLPPVSSENKSINILNSPKFKIFTKLVCLADNGVFFLIDCTYGLVNQKPSVVFVPTLANKDDVAVDFVACKHLSNMIIVFGKTGKVFMMDIEQGHFVIELDNNGFKVGVEQYQLFLASKDSLLYFRGESKENKSSNLLCHSLRLIPQMDEYFSRNIQVFDNFLPNGSFLNERIKSLMKIRTDEIPARRERLKKNWTNLITRKNKF